MIFSLLNKFNKKPNPKDNQSMKHIVLGTELNAPLKECEEKILFGCGCFWGAEKGFWKLPGVITTAVGYSGGETKNPTYNQVCSGRTGHTEVVMVTWDKSLIDLSDLLKMFWECHDPTQGNRQGNDRGTQYRSAVFTYNQNHLEIVLASKNYYQELLHEAGYKEITTEIKNNQEFHIAEEYHQQYLARPSSRPYCSAMPTRIKLGNFPGSRYLLKETVWDNFDWGISHCVLRSDNEPLRNS